mmetsp:Transcript_16574/g.28208  ORF Transcript_16574/g.28208 Transcript_16574/m.28208 type:complete len:102 (+) Transcript_16574:195-500(+)
MHSSQLGSSHANGKYQNYDQHYNKQSHNSIMEKQRRVGGVNSTATSLKGAADNAGGYDNSTSNYYNNSNLMSQSHKVSRHPNPIEHSSMQPKGLITSKNSG